MLVFPMTDTIPTPKKNADLPVRVASAVVMLAVAGTALWLGGWWWSAFVVAIALGVAFEWNRLVRSFAQSGYIHGIWNVFGFVYLVVAALILIILRLYEGNELTGSGLQLTSLLLAMVIGVDVGAYFLGRAVGGPKIAPTISPSKTWAGLFGGCLGALLIYCSYMWIMIERDSYAGSEGYEIFLRSFSTAILYSVGIAICAQAGDFFESWMKRRAGMKDSSNLIPGHGGLFDRVDGLLAVSFGLGLYWSAEFLLG